MYFSDKFICADRKYSTHGEPVAAPLFRREFEYDGTGSAALTLTGLGFYRLFVNGAELTKGLLSPYISNSNDIVYYDCYDITGQLVKGKNVIGVILGNGMQNCYGGFTWKFDQTPFRTAPLLALALELDGRVAFEADESFLTHPSAIISDDLRTGEVFDAREKINGWNLPGFSANAWKHAVAAEAPKGEKRLCEAAPIKVRKELKAADIWQEDDGYVFDFGENSAGNIRLTVCGRRGQRIHFLYGEELDGGGRLVLRSTDYPDGGKCRQEDTYICAGDGIEVYEPSFTYHGFRYVKVFGIDEEQATADLITYAVMNTELERCGGFECSDETICRIDSMAENSTLSNWHHFHTDCPQREKNGWTADTALSAEHVMLKWNAEKNYREWMRNVCAAQDERGAFPGIVPTWGWGYTWGNGPAWDCVITEIPYQVHRYTGDKRIIEECRGAIMKYIAYLGTRKNENGLLEFGLGDWLPPERPIKAPLALTDSIMSMDIARKAEKLMRVIGAETDAEICGDFWRTLRERIRENLLDKKTVLFAGDCQTSQAMGIYYGLLEPEETAAGVERLIEIIHRDDELITTGVLGLKVIFHVLSEFGHSDLAYRMITTPRQPSYGYWVRKGNTTFEECMGEMNDGYPVSRNHHFMSDVSAWFMKCLCGINYNPDITEKKKIIISPHFIDEIRSARAYHVCAEGEIAVSYVNYKDEVLMSVEVPEGIDAEIRLQGFCDLLGRQRFSAMTAKYRLVRQEKA